MALWSKRCLRNFLIPFLSVLVGCKAFAKNHSHEKLISDLRQFCELDGVNSSDAIYDDSVKQENKLNFAIDHQWLSQYKLQMSVKAFQENTLNHHKFIDIDGIHQHLKADTSSYITVAKSAFIFKNKTPDYFCEENIFNKEFLAAAFNGSSIISDENSYQSVKIQTPIKFMFIKLGQIDTTVHVKTFDSFDAFLHSEVPIESHDYWHEISKIGNLPLKKITTTYSRHEDISPNYYSMGARTTNFYYYINSDHTLHVSFKIVSFQNIPALAYEATLKQQYTGTWKSLNKIQEIKT